MPAGFQLPPERDLASALAISRATVVSAYRELEARGLVRGYVGRGTFVSARPDAASAPFAWRGKISAAAMQTTDRRSAIWSGTPPIPDRVARRRRAGARLLSDRGVSARRRRGADQRWHAAWGHGPTEGQPLLRETLAERFGGEPEHILVIAGAQQGLDLLARCLIDRGDAVIIDRPGYLGRIQSSAPPARAWSAGT